MALKTLVEQANPESPAMPVRPKRGRKSIPEETRRTRAISVAYTAGEYREVSRRARVRGQKVAAYLRACEAHCAEFGFVESVLKGEGSGEDDEAQPGQER